MIFSLSMVTPSLILFDKTLRELIFLSSCFFLQGLDP
ncbi:hypothetical protein [Proteiniclasticum ruminis]